MQHQASDLGQKRRERQAKDQQLQIAFYGSAICLGVAVYTTARLFRLEKALQEAGVIQIDKFWQIGSR